MHKNSRSNTLNLSQILSQKTNDKKKLKFTDLTVKHLKPLGKRTIFWFEGMSGLGLRVSPKGRKTWVYMFQFNGKSRMMTLGKYPKMSLSEARIGYSKAVHKTDFEIDPAKEKVINNEIELKAITVEDLSVEYIKYCIAKGEVSWKEKQRAINKELLPIIGNKKVKDITFRDIAPIINNIHIERKATTQAQRLLSHARCMFKYAKNGLGLIEINPCSDLEAPKRQKNPRYALNTKDIYRFWNNIDYTFMKPVVRLGMKFMFCTLARGVEVRKMKWSDINVKDKTWLIPSENAKNGKAILLPLNSYALTILKEIYQYTGHSDFVFGWNRSLNSGQQLLDKQEMTPMGVTAFSHALRDNFDLLLIERKFTPHDLRRTGATCLTSVGYSREWVSKLLNHTPNNVTSMVYDVFDYFEEKRAGMESIKYILDRILSAEDINLVPSLRTIRKEFIAQKLIYQFLDEAYFEPRKFVDNSQDFQSSFSSLVSYKLSFSHDGSDYEA